jgi:hypothetical protein
MFGIADSTGMRKLEVAFKNCVRFVYGLRRYDHVSEYSRNILGDSFSKYYELRASCMTIKTTYPSYLNEYLFFDSLRRWHRLLCLTTPSCRHFYGKTFFVSIVNSWNRLPVEVKCSASMDIFKRTCFMFLAGGAEDEHVLRVL